MVSPVYTILYFHLFLSSLFYIAKAGVTYNVATFGARPDGKTDATQPFLEAWASACGSTKAAKMYVPKGSFLLRAVEFRGPCKNSVKVQIAGTLVAPMDYRVVGNSGSWILFIQINGLTVVGGSFNANGAGLWACKKSGKNCPVGARSITFNWVNNAVISGLSSINSQLMHMVINSCNNVRVNSVKMTASGLSPNTDGIHVQSSTGVTISNAKIQTGDDCISIGPGTRNLWMEQIQCGPGHGVSIGSLGRDFNEDGVQNVTLVNSVLTGATNGLRIKTWARPSTGFVRNINYQNIMMRNVENPIIIDQNYCPNNQGCPGQSSGIKISQITYKNIQGTSASPIAMVFDCSPSSPCSGIRLQDIKVTYLSTGKAQSLCKNIGGSATGLILPVNCL